MNDSSFAERVEGVFLEAAALHPAARETYLARVCAGDPRLLHEVRSLLEADDRASEFLETPPSSPALAFEGIEAADAADPLLGEPLGVYRIVRRLGAGGMSVVYLAERDDAEIAQRVAVKVIKRGMDSEEIVARFRAERRLLASLDHPHIARFLDGGVAPDGRPYLVMELIDGAPITVACAARRLPLRDRIRLFREACDAVHFAHQRLVVHRDLKPSNLFVTDDGRAKLLDFGIAKVLDPEDSESGGTPTKTATRLMTPRYASPEQLRGERTTIATDVYSLGVILGELLDPIDARRGDLALIAAKATHTSADRRYASVAAFAEDLRLQETGFPVSARPDSFGYRVAAFTRRNPALAVSGVLLAALLAAFGVTTSLQLRRIAAERDRANREAESSRETADFLESLFRVADPNEARGRAITAREILADGAMRLESDLEKQPLVRARLLRTIGRVQANLGLHGDAGRHLERALELMRTEGGDALDVASALDALANVRRLEGDTPEALEHAEEALRVREAALDPSDPRIAPSLNNVAVLRIRQGDLDGARRLLQRAIAIREAASEPDPIGLSAPLHTLANVEFNRGDRDAARVLFERSLALLEGALGPDHPRLTAPLGSLAEIASEDGRHAEAESLQRRAIAIGKSTRGEEHDEVGAGLADLAIILKNAGRPREAIETASQAVAILEKALGPDHPSLASALLTLAQVSVQVGERGAALRHGERAVRILDTRFAADHPAAQEGRRALEEIRAAANDAPAPRSP